MVSKLKQSLIQCILLQLAIFCDFNFAAKTKFKTGFYPGRVKPSRYEYPKHNGWMLPEEAAELCEKDLACAGFTFKGAYR